jgi:hypothetical protein
MHFVRIVEKNTARQIKACTSRNLSPMLSLDLILTTKWSPTNQGAIIIDFLKDKFSVQRISGSLRCCYFPSHLPCGSLRFACHIQYKRTSYQHRDHIRFWTYKLTAIKSIRRKYKMSQQVTAFALGLYDKKSRHTPGWSHKLASHKILNRVFSKMLSDCWGSNNGNKAS